MRIVAVTGSVRVLLDPGDGCVKCDAGQLSRTVEGFSAWRRPLKEHWRWSAPVRIFWILAASRRGPAPVERRRRKKFLECFPYLKRCADALKIPVSIDTQKAGVAEIALGAGAEIVNDISGLMNDPELAKVAARHKAPIILMHMRGTPRTMQQGPFAKDALKDVVAGLNNRLRRPARRELRNHRL